MKKKMLFIFFTLLLTGNLLAQAQNSDINPLEKLKDLPKKIRTTIRNTKGYEMNEFRRQKEHIAEFGKYCASFYNAIKERSVQKAEMAMQNMQQLTPELFEKALSYVS